MLRPTSSELVLFPVFWVSNIPRYFCFALIPLISDGSLKSSNQTKYNLDYVCLSFFLQMLPVQNTERKQS